MIVDPQALTLPEWADAVTLQGNFRYPLARLEGDDWRTFAVSLLRVPELAGRVIPDPYQFDDWRDWAERAAPMLGGVN